jgi:hypothetical protein
MSEEALSVRTRVVAIDAPDHEDDLQGHLDIRYWLEQGNEVLGLVTARIFFDDESVSLAKLQEDAISKGYQLMADILKHRNPTE